jgi:tetratricopeptide (TPR) repeat protein
MELIYTFEEYLKITTLRLQLAYQHGAGQMAPKGHDIFVIFSEAINEQEAIRADFEEQLIAQIAPQRVRRIRFYPDDPPEAAGLLFGRLGLNPPSPDQVVFIYDVRHAFPGLFNSLNYQRELIPEQGWRLVFWTNFDTVVAIMRNAPDFWAFVHGKVDLSLYSGKEELAFVDELADKYLEWEDTFAEYSEEERLRRIRLREYFLTHLPDNDLAIPYRQYYHYIVGILYFYGQELETAEEHLQKATSFAVLMRDKGRQAQSYNRFGTLYEREGKDDEAISAYQRAITLDSSLASAHYNLAKVYQKLGRDNEARASYQQARSLTANKSYLLRPIDPSTKAPE